MLSRSLYCFDKINDYSTDINLSDEIYEFPVFYQMKIPQATKNIFEEFLSCDCVNFTVNVVYHRQKCWSNVEEGESIAKKKFECLNIQYGKDIH